MITSSCLSCLLLIYSRLIPIICRLSRYLWVHLNLLPSQYLVFESCSVSYFKLFVESSSFLSIVFLCLLGCICSPSLVLLDFSGFWPWTVFLTYPDFWIPLLYFCYSFCVWPLFGLWPQSLPGPQIDFPCLGPSHHHTVTRIVFI